MKKKLFLGYKLRRLREQRNMSQAAMARLLDLSPSYLNQLENNQRPLTVAVLLRIAQELEVDVATLAEDEEARLVSDLRETLSDPLFNGDPPSTTELRTLASMSPEVARRVLSLYQAYQQLNERLQAMADDLHNHGQDETTGNPHFPYEEVRDYFYYCNNYFSPLDEAAEALVEREGFTIGDMTQDLSLYLKMKHDVRVRLVSEDDLAMRRFDPATGTLHMSALLDGPSRTFHLAHQIALIGFGGVIEDLVNAANLSSDDARSICRVGLANYFAGALVMPYSRFLRAAREVRHDIEVLQSRFGTSFEQACHRLSTLQRPGHKGVPFYFVRVDMAGNITKRHSATRLHFARFGGTCPKWNVHEAFAQPGKILVQMAKMPDDTPYICVARTVTKGGGAFLKPSRQFAVGLGCEVSYAADVVYADAVDVNAQATAVPIGVNCRICERTDCQQRAFPPIGSRVSVDSNNRSFVPYLFA
ncbi:helix-turn-helix domain-containing protein [Novispirillum itersonii]|uniref:helix-turn-helix domain-containing protein n=1 Tax=Novispirillum itersonii TaxID=189 RepID=UPI00036B947D|nr:short-chain fatty acyl-CoA regulator family protein [Novispirillum itersonii]